MQSGHFFFGTSPVALHYTQKKKKEKKRKRIWNNKKNYNEHVPIYTSHGQVMVALHIGYNLILRRKCMAENRSFFFLPLRQTAENIVYIEA